LQINGFTCFKDEVCLSFDNLERFVICGPTGAGKSSLLEAILFALYGEVPRTSKHGLKDLISHGRDRLSVLLDFRTGDQLHRVTRKKFANPKRAAEAQLERFDGDKFVPLTDQVRNVDAELLRLLGLGFQAFTQAVFLPQGQFAAFLQCEPRDRRDMLNDLLRLQVYERMRELAAARAGGHGTEKTSLERRLAEDFQGVTAQALAGLERQQSAVQDKVDESGRRLSQLQENLVAARRDYERTRELAEREECLTALERCRPEIEAQERQAAEAQRAAGLLPLLDQADEARQEQEKRAAELIQAEKDCREVQKAADEALAARDQARAAAAVLPALHLKRLKLAEVAGKLTHRDDLEKQCADWRAALAERREKQTRRDVHRQQLARELAALRVEQDTARAELAAIGHDADLDRRLETVRDRAAQLQGRRERLAEAARLFEQKKTAAAEAATVAAAAIHGRDETERAKTRAEERAAAARRELTAAQNAHAAAHLRSSLVAGAPCPVCWQPVSDLPRQEPVPVLVQLLEDVRRAENALANTSEQLIQLTALAASADACATRARQEAEENGAAWAECKRAVAALTRSLQAGVGDRLPDVRGDTVEARILAAVAEMAVRRQKHEQAAKRATERDQQIVLKHQKEEAARLETAALTAAVAEAESRLGQLETSLERVRAEIRAVTGAADPGAEQEQVARRIADLESVLAAAETAAAEAGRHLAEAHGRVEQLRHVAANAVTRARDAARKAQETLQAAGFVDSAAVRAAALPATRLEQLRAELAGYRTELHALEARVTVLLHELQGRRVDEAEYQAAEQAHRLCVDEDQKARKEQALLAEKIRTLTEKLARAEDLRRELDNQRRRHRIYRRLADDLRNDRFQAYLLEEILGELVRGAAYQLSRLTGDRYGLDYVDDEILVIDHDHAGERRSTDTLSGGETFLASLALALELSAQVQRTLGAVHVDCLFIDEGFGTLDPETLRVAADAVRGLQVSGRMVGIITHIPELKDEFDQRVIVAREGGLACVRVEGV
jgi:exonuclease SbcC